MKKTKILYVILICLLGVLFIGFVLLLVDFANDYRCSTTTDIRWFIDNNCMRYIK